MRDLRLTVRSLLAAPLVAVLWGNRAAIHVGVRRNQLAASPSVVPDFSGTWSGTYQVDSCATSIPVRTAARRSKAIPDHIR